MSASSASSVPGSARPHQQEVVGSPWWARMHACMHHPMQRVLRAKDDRRRSLQTVNTLEACVNPEII